jgi:hypothetical protein
MFSHFCIYIGILVCNTTGVTSGAVTVYLCRISEFLVWLVLLNLYISEYHPVIVVICFHSSLAWFGFMVFSATFNNISAIFYEYL